jgi:transcriptional regulator with XRE-family HTH domain
MARNIKLEEARLKQHLSLYEASGRLAVHKNTLLGWETGKHKPHLSYLTALCKVYDATPEELGLEELVRSKEHRESASPEVAASVTPPGSDICIIEDLEVHLLTTVGRWNRRKVPYDGLQAMIDQQIRRYDDMSEQEKDSAENPERRKALRILATLPIGIYGLTVTGSVLQLSAEELLPHCAAGLTACWHLSKGKELPLVQAVVAAYLPTLTNLAREATRYQKAAAGLVAQAHLLSGLLAMHLDSLGASEAHYKEALKYSQVAEDHNLEVAVLCWLCENFRYTKRFHKALETYKKALPYLNQASYLVRSNMYSGLARVQALSGQKQNAMSSLGLAQEAFFAQSENDSGVLYTDYGQSNLILRDGMTYYYLGQNEESGQKQKTQYNKALDSFIQVRSLRSDVQISERMRLEFLNNQARAAFGLRDMEQCCTYLESAVTGALLLGSEQRYIEAREIYEMMTIVWGEEPRVKALRDLFRRG